MDNELLAIVSVPKDKRVYCQEKNCKHVVYQSIHIVRVDGAIKVFGSTCFKKNIRSLIPDKTNSPRYFNSGGNVLSDKDRELLANNTDELVRRFEEEFQLRQAEIEQERIEKAQEKAREDEVIRRISERQVAQLEPVLSAVHTNTNQLPYSLIRKPDSAYASVYEIPKVRAVIGLDIPPEELTRMDNKHLLKLSEQAIQYVFKYERRLPYTNSLSLYKRDVQRLLQSLYRSREKVR